MVFVKVAHVSSMGARTVMTMRAAENRTITTKYMPKMHFRIPECCMEETETRNEMSDLLAADD